MDIVSIHILHRCREEWSHNTVPVREILLIKLLLYESRHVCFFGESGECIVSREKSELDHWFIHVCHLKYISAVKGYLRWNVWGVLEYFILNLDRNSPVTELTLTMNREFSLPDELFSETSLILKKCRSHVKKPTVLPSLNQKLMHNRCWTPYNCTSFPNFVWDHRRTSREHRACSGGSHYGPATASSMLRDCREVTELALSGVSSLRYTLVVLSR